MSASYGKALRRHLRSRRPKVFADPSDWKDYMNVKEYLIDDQQQQSANENNNFIANNDNNFAPPNNNNCAANNNNNCVTNNITNNSELLSGILRGFVDERCLEALEHSSMLDGSVDNDSDNIRNDHLNNHDNERSNGVGGPKVRNGEAVVYSHHANSPLPPSDAANVDAIFLAKCRAELVDALTKLGI